MKEKKLTRLLYIISTNGNFNQLVRENITYKDITILTNYAVEKNLLSYANEKISLTEEGTEYLTNSLSLIKKKNKEEWITKDTKSQIDKIDKNFIFLPRQNELTF